MRKTFSTLGVAAALLCLASATAAAQVQNNNSDHIGTGLAGSALSGMYTPGMYAPGSAGGGAAVTVASLANEELKLACGTASQRAVGAVLSGGSTTELGESLTRAGAPAAQVAALMSALTNLGRNPSPAALKTAVLAYNAVINASPASFWNNPPARLEAIRGALLEIRLGGPIGTPPACPAPAPAPAPPPPPAPAPAPAPAPPPPPAPAPARARELFTLKAVLFEFNKSTLTRGAKDTLGVAVRYLKDHDDVRVEIQGHTDSKGSDDYNMKLGTRRAESVKAYLGAQGIKTDRISTRSFGESQPVADNELNGKDNPAGRALNRRVVIIEVP
jgi:outer membrane protein OmpA-like peptidoglycan-associated protein